MSCFLPGKNGTADWLEIKIKIKSALYSTLSGTYNVKNHAGIIGRPLWLIHSG